ncbi:MAG: dipeptidase [Blautia sp.]|nr:dipeptidase [Blautia sp.]MDD7728165.1 dipeptidase [Clostridia bacterium]MDY5665401.1 dipeptidase [Blautia sp.]
MIDLHCDTISKLAMPMHKGNLVHNPYSVDLERLEKAGSLLQCFSTFFDAGVYPKFFRDEKAFKKADHMIDVFEKNLELCEGRLVWVQSWKDLESCMEEKKVGALLTLEDGAAVGSSMEKLHHFYERGIRLITLTWNHENAIGYPNSDNPEIMSSGLKPFGLEMIEEMNRLGMIIDVSHLSDGGFWDVARHSSKPFIASHSNSRSITVHSRNLTDVMIKTIAEKGGVIGLNFCPGFLGTDKKSSISHMLHHVKHIYEVGGEDVLALGTDLDGTGGKMQINSCDEMWRLKEALQKHRMPSRVIDKMWQNNALRVMKEIL